MYKLALLSIVSLALYMQFSNAQVVAPAIPGNGQMNFPLAEDNYTTGENKLWVLTTGAMIFSMQCGFAFLEAGSIRKKNAHVVFYRITLHSLVGVLAFWLAGYAFAYGDAYNNMIGGQDFYAGHNWDQPAPQIGEVTQYSNWVAIYSVAVVVVDITNGSLSERASLTGTTIHAFIMILIIWPVAVAWTWGQGWLWQIGYSDFSGSGVVHCMGAFSGLAGIFIVGPRYNRWGMYEDISVDKSLTGSEPESAKNLLGKEVDTNAIGTFMQEEGNRKKTINYTSLTRLRNKVWEDDYETFGVTNISYYLFGGLFLWVGFIFFNAGATIGVLKVNNGTPVNFMEEMEHAAANTFLAGCSAGLFALIFKSPMINGWSAPRKLRDECGAVCNAFLAGMVANGGGMNLFDPWAAFVVGLIGGIVYCVLCKIFEHYHIDDAVEAVQLHGGAGSTGVFCNAFFRHDVGYFYKMSKGAGIFGYQLLGWVVLCAWSFLASSIVWGLLKWFGLLRTPLKTEVIGYDFLEHAHDIDFTGKRLVKKKVSHSHPEHSQLHAEEHETPKDKYTHVEMTPSKERMADFGTPKH
jgi:Amt family ammonium transporter